MQPSSSSCSLAGFNLDSARRRIVLLLLLSLLAACLTGAHVYVMAQGANYAGFLLFLDHLFDITIVVILLAICAAVGKRLLTLCSYDFDSPLELLLFSVALGCGLVSTILLILGFLSGLQTITLTTILVVLGGLTTKDSLALPRLVRQAALEVKTRSNILSLLVFGIVAAFMISQALLPPTDWDSLVYHLRVPAQFLQTGRIFLPEDNLHVAFVQLVHMLYLPLLAYGSTSGPALLSAFFAFLLGLAVFALSSRFFGGTTAAFSLAILWANTMVLLVAITPRVDVTLAYYLLLTHYALLRASSSWKYFYLSAILLGLTIGVKQNALIYALALSPLIVWVAYLRKDSLRAFILCLSAYGLLALGGSSLWLIKNWSLFEAPFYPYFAQRKVDPWLAFFYPEKIHPQIVNVYAEVRAPFNLIDLFLNPLALTVELEAFFYHVTPLFVCLVLWLIYYSKNKALNWLMIPALCYFAVTLMFSSKTNLRYLLPVLAPFTIVVVHVTIDRLARLFGLKKALILFHIVSLVVLWPSAKTLSLWTTKKMTVPYLTGFTSRENYLLSDVFPLNYSAFAEVASYVNQHASSKDRVLMLFEARGFYFDVPVIQDNLLSNWLLLANRASSLHCLKSTGISHVLLNRGALNYFSIRGLDRSTVRFDEFSKFEEDCLTPIFESPTYVLYKVR